MYIQLTTRCNMKCPHCCMSATNRGIHMSREVLIDAMSIATDRGDYVCIGGGEPTCHPEFKGFIRKALEYAWDMDFPLLIVTNGKKANHAHWLLGLVEEEYPIQVELSQDQWHDPIQQGVIDRFVSMARYHRHNVGIRSNKYVIPVGRGVNLPESQNTPEWLDCACLDYLVDPRGSIWSCGCKTHLIGTVDNPDCLDNYDMEFAHTGGFNPED